MSIKQQLSACLKQALQMEQEAQSLGLGPREQVRLAALLHSAKEALAEAEKLVLAEAGGEQQETAAKLRLWERKLLDLSLRNNLLNMRLGKNAIPFVHDDIATLEDELDQGKEFLLEQKELKPVYRAVRNNLEETGVNTLFLTLGTLRWQERTGAKQYEAPILLLPVEIVSLKKDRYAIRKRDEETVLNITLMEFLKQNFEIEVEGLNPLPRDMHGIDVSLVLHTIREAVREQEGWEIEEKAVLGIFSFSKFVMWNDIHRHTTEIMGNDIIRSLIEGRLMMEKKDNVVDAKEMDRMVRPDACSIPVDADSSQLEAVVEATNGQSFILYGPPGTGKSQTITNLIANALYHNKRVLFVAEKKAALDVVQKRLAKIGLSPFCLELHSNKVDKQFFLRQMQTAFTTEGMQQSEEYKRVAEALYAQRLQLIDYIDALHQKQGNCYSLYECINRYLSMNVSPMKLPKDLAKGLNAERIEKYCDSIMAMDSGKMILGTSPQDHPLRGLLPKPKKAAKTTAYVSAFQMADTLEKQIPQLSQVLLGVKQQLERGKQMSYFNKTPRQCLESDYKWKKFAQLADVSEDLLNNIEALDEAVKRWNEHLGMLPQWEEYAALFTTLKDEGLTEAVEMFQSGVPVQQIKQSFLSAVYYQMAWDIINGNASLSQFNGMRFEQVITKYNQLMREFQELSRKELVARLSAKVPVDTRDPQLSSELTLLRKRIGNKGRGTSIRGMIDQMPHLLPTLCPVMLMSPLSVAQYIDIDAPKFDLVVFDEASQMPTSEAVGAIARAKAAVIVGDPRQMPPTSFFSVTSADDEEADFDDLESILDDCISLSMPTRYLGWHYRSKHESLIAFSNQNYYEGRLVTFPSADDMVSHVTWQHVDGFYDYGKTRTNRAEAKAIVAKAINLMQQQPERSVGIVAFSKQQSDLIEDLWNEELAKLPELDIQNQEASEPLFIKNLENVQGDERDIILFSVGYGPDKEGHVSMNFGPLNKAGGERRLNVAVSRARYEMHVFSTLRPEQIDERRTQAEGVLGLKQFLLFAQRGSVVHDQANQNLSADSSHEPDGVTVSMISEALKKKGYDVRTNVGTSSFRIDIAVVDPANAERYILGIICDGSNYRKMKTARDREIVRPSVLRMLGWRLAHVWSVDWLRDKETVIGEIIKLINLY